MKAVHVIAIVLVIVGALNWGLWGLFGLDLVARVFGGSASSLSRLVYILVGLSGVWTLCSIKSLCGCCNKKK